MKSSIQVGPIKESELEEAGRIVRLAFGTFLGLPTPTDFMDDRDLMKPRWRSANVKVVAARENGRLVGSNVVTRWGSFGFFGPLTVLPEYWERGVGQKLLEATMKVFERWGVRHTGLYTFAHSAKHVALYQKFGNNILDFTDGSAHTELMSNDSKHATLRDAILYFADFEHCKDFMVQLRWPEGNITCPRCGGDRLCWVEKQRLWKCYEGHKQPTFTLKTGTIFEDSPIALEKWLPATWLLLNCKNGISSYEVARDLGVTQKTAWFMLGRIRLAMQDEETGGKLGGPGVEIEADETYIGGKARNMHPARRNKMRERGDFGKTIVSAVLERHGHVRATVLPNRRKKAIQAHLRDHVEPGSTVYTDELLSYDGLDDYTHQVINHAEKYVDGQIHTNGMENFWSLLKRGLKGTYIAVEPFHLFRYVDEQAFRFNNRQTDDVHRFVIGMKQIVGRRLTYKQLTGKAEVTQHG